MPKDQAPRRGSGELGFEICLDPVLAARYDKQRRAEIAVLYGTSIQKKEQERERSRSLMGRTANTAHDDDDDESSSGSSSSSDEDDDDESSLGIRIFPHLQNPNKYFRLNDSRPVEDPGIELRLKERHSPKAFIRRKRRQQLRRLLVAVLGFVLGVLLVALAARNKDDQSSALAEAGDTSSSVAGNNNNNNTDASGDAATVPTLAVSATEYSLGQKIYVEYDYPPEGTLLPDPGQDWIGIFPVTDGAVFEGLLRTPEAQLRLCGQPSPCDEGGNPDDLLDGRVVFGDPLLENGEDAMAEFLEGSTWSWPLEEGAYRAYLVRGGDGTPDGSSLELLAASEAFVVTGVSYRESAIGTLRAAEADLRAMLEDDPSLGPKLVRLGFHGCTGVCDGCVDLDDPENAGLDIPIGALEPLVDLYEHAGVSRADLWALAASVAADAAQDDDDGPALDWSLGFVGRVNCEDASKKCEGSNGKKRNCGPTTGAFVELPDADATTREVFEFFGDEFGLSVRETVALMGAHTLGSLSREHQGFHGPNGRVPNHLSLDNGYYQSLVGGGASIEDRIELALPWTEVTIDNSDLPGIPDRRAWQAVSPDGDETPLLMVNADIALVRELDETNLGEDGTVACAFSNRASQQRPRCPHAERSLGHAADYQADNALWLRDFHAVFRRVLNHGYEDQYEPDRVCPEGVCFYEDR